VEDQPAPRDPYGVSKWEAERALASVSADTGMETVIIRSPLVYGPGVAGNFLQLLKAIRRRIPLPFAGVKNRRSLVYLGNLVDGLTCCARDKRAAGQTYLISDGEDLSTPELMRRLGAAMGTVVHLWPVPVLLLRGIALITGQRAAMDRLTGCLQVDSSKIRQELDWHPPFSVNEGIADTAVWFSSRSTA
jgi:nucleoside-diphosphate-sugar epimerase